MCAAWGMMFPFCMAGLEMQVGLAIVAFTGVIVH